MDCKERNFGHASSVNFQFFVMFILLLAHNNQGSPYSNVEKNVFHYALIKGHSKGCQGGLKGVKWVHFGCLMDFQGWLKGVSKLYLGAPKESQRVSTS